MLYVEFDSASNDAIFRWGHRWKTWDLIQNTGFFRFFRKVFTVAIRYITCACPKNGCAELRIKFCIEWYYFQGLLSGKKIWSGLWQEIINDFMALSDWIFFSPITTLENSIIRCRIKFCIQHNLKESQHKHTGESFHKKLESGANFTYVIIRHLKPSQTIQNYIKLPQTISNHLKPSKIFQSMLSHNKPI